MRRTTILVLFGAALGAVLATGMPREAGAAPGLLCSAGGNNGDECDFDSDCPNGACVAAQFICEGGTRDTDICDCPESTCVRGACSGGPRENAACDPANECDGGTCQQTSRICNAGDLKGFGCANNGQCGDGAVCVANGQFCWGGSFFKFGCVDDDDCDPEGDAGICRGPAQRVPIVQICSAGRDDGDRCAGDNNCPNGACVLGQTVCDGGDTRDGFFCESTTDCDRDASCTLSQKLCGAGDNKGATCVDDRTCGGGECISTGLLCNGGEGENFSCVDDDECSGRGDCVVPGQVRPTATRTPVGGTPGPTTTRRPTRAPTSNGNGNGNDDDDNNSLGCQIDPAASGSGAALLLGVIVIRALRRARR
jgi:hypothetical protein